MQWNALESNIIVLIDVIDGIGGDSDFISKVSTDHKSFCRIRGPELS